MFSSACSFPHLQQEQASHIIGSIGTMGTANRICRPIVSTSACKILVGNNFLAKTAQLNNNDGKITTMSNKNESNNIKGNFSVKDIVNNSKASPEQLTLVANQLVHHLPRFFSQPHPFDLYTKDIVFIDNIRSMRIQGASQYALQIALIKLYHNIRYTSVKAELLNLVKYPEESCIKIRWRIITKPGIIQFILFFYKFHSIEKWKDGISTMHVNKEGKIYCHVCDNIDVETDDIKIKKVVKNPLVDRGLNV